jgi:hypothetical protein
MPSLDNRALPFHCIKPTKKEQNQKKMPLPPPKIRTACGTYLYFTEPGTLETFLQDKRQILKNYFQKIRIEGGVEYWTCNQDDNPRN